MSRRARRPARPRPGRDGDSRGGRKSARGSRTDAAPAAHPLSAVTAAGRIVSQLRVPDKTNEISAFTALPAPFDMASTW
ncbi:hypothetical protein [Streptomyces sp. NBC_01431]|uniref:hypothetical protein n=1 Tax=Streptomyces sp. NBC_01431 TaxID=2903863 RepID=UPI002E37B733|nr:hypothetical protein [Streptomyces sp. NBC_01431]